MYLVLTKTNGRRTCVNVASFSECSDSAPADNDPKTDVTDVGGNVHYVMEGFDDVLQLIVDGHELASAAGDHSHSELLVVSKELDMSLPDGVALDISDPNSAGGSTTVIAIEEAPADDEDDDTLPAKG